MEFLGGLWFPAIAFVLGAVCGAALMFLLRRPSVVAEEAPWADVPDPAAPDDASSYIDPSTGLASRRYVEMFLRSEISRSERLAKPVSVAVFDLDGFRTLLDSVGKVAIDQAVSSIGAALKARLRDYDVAGRYSPGRLIVVMPESSAAQAFETAERLHASLASLRLGNKPLTVSVGVATFPDHAPEAEGLINVAHHALNTGRAAGSGSQVHWCEELDKAS